MRHPASQFTKCVVRHRVIAVEHESLAGIRQGGGIGLKNGACRATLRKRRCRGTTDHEQRRDKRRETICQETRKSAQWSQGRA